MSTTFLHNLCKKKKEKKIQIKNQNQNTNPKPVKLKRGKKFQLRVTSHVL